MTEAQIMLVMKLTDLIILVGQRIQQVKGMTDEEAKTELVNAKMTTDTLVSSVLRGQ